MCLPRAEYAGDTFNVESAFFLAQNLFDDDVPPLAPTDKPKEKAVTAASEKTTHKTVKKKKRKKKVKKKATSTAENEAVKTPSYSTAALARSSYEWAPESEALSLTTEAKGVPLFNAAPVNKPTAQSQSSSVEKSNETLAEKKENFKISRIPVTQVLIVAAFVLLFLLYRYRVSKQMKHKKY